MRDALEIEYDPRDDQPEYDPRAESSIKFGEELVERVERMIAGNTTEYWVKHFEAAGVPVGEILFVEELIKHPQVTSNNYHVELEHELTGPQTMAATPFTISKTPPQPQGASPPLGRYTDAVLAEAGVSVEVIESLRADGVIR